jgi:hypothetical protein
VDVPEGPPAVLAHLTGRDHAWKPPTLAPDRQAAPRQPGLVGVDVHPADVGQGDLELAAEAPQPVGPVQAARL